MNNTTLYKGDCLEVMKDIESGSIDAIITDPPYGTTACKWDSVIPFEPMWEQLNRIIKPNGAIVLFSAQPFTSALVMSNPKMFKYEWIWEKNKGSNFANVKYMPFKQHENVLIFYNKKPTYNEQRIMRSNKSLKRDPIGKCRTSFQKKTHNEDVDHYGSMKRKPVKISSDGTRPPKTVIKFDLDFFPNSKYKHPTQKPVALMEYLIKTYTNEGELVLDFTMGSGSTGVACVNTNRKFIGIEQDDKYFQIATDRINNIPNTLF